MQDSNISLRYNKLLYIDPLSPNGHINFNKIYIEALFKIFESIDFAFKQGYEEKLPIPKNAKIYSIPEKYYISSDNKIANRFKYFQINKYIKKHCNINQYDFVIFSSYEEISLYLSFFSRTLIIVNHNNLCGLHNPIKLHFFKKVANKNINIVFENYMRDYLSLLGVKNIYTIHHGLTNPYDKKIKEDTDLINDFAYIENFKYVIFSPSSTSTDTNFLGNLISNDEFKMFLHENGILLILKYKQLNYDSGNIRIIDNYLTDSQYKYIFLRSDLILIPYSNNFSYRVSAVLFEAMSNNKLCILSNIRALNIYKDYFNYDPYYENIEELMIKISLIIDLPDKIKNNPYKNINKLNPDFSVFFFN